MPATNYPGGLSSFGFPLVGSGNYIGVGNGNVPVHVLFVQNTNGTDANGRGIDASRPFKTLAYAISKCTADNDDIIFVLPGHTEAITAAASIAMNVAGVRVVGLGAGMSRPTFTFTTATSATITVTAARCSIINCVFDLTGFAGVVTGIVISGTGFLLQDCLITQSNATNQATSSITFLAGGDRANLVRVEIDAETAGPAQAILGSGAVSKLFIDDCNIHGNFSVACLANSSTFHFTQLRFRNNRWRQANGTAKVIYNLTTSSTGVMEYNTYEGTTWSTAADFMTGGTSTSLRHFQNYGFDDGAGAVSGVLVPAAGTIA